MGAVYVALQLGTQKERALKVMRPSLVRDARSRERFLYEARASASLDSDHVVDVVAAGVDDATGAPWIAMELLRGETLADAVARRQRMPPREVRECFDQLRHALTAAHSIGLVHRDLKPENLFLEAPRRSDVSFTLKVLDFGIAKTLDANDVAKSTGSSVGSPLWMAPEQANAQPVSTATDVWPLGLLAFWMLTGRVYWNAPYGDGITLAGLLTEILIAPFEWPSQRAANSGLAGLLPPDFDEWFAHCLVRDPGARYPDGARAISALLERLDRWLGTPAISQHQPGWSNAAPTPFGPLASLPGVGFATAPTAPSTKIQPSRVKRYALIGVAAVTVSLAGGLALASLFNEDEPSPSPQLSSAPLAMPPPLVAMNPRTILDEPTPHRAVEEPVIQPAAVAAPTPPIAPTHVTPPRIAHAPVVHTPPTTATTAPLTTPPTHGPAPPITNRTAAIASMLDSADRMEASGNHAAASSVRDSAWSYLHNLEGQVDQMRASDPSSAAALHLAAVEVRNYLTQRLGRHP